MEQPDKGTFEVGETVVTAYVDQQHEAIDPNKTDIPVVSDGAGSSALAKEINARAPLPL